MSHTIDFTTQIPYVFWSGELRNNSMPNWTDRSLGSKTLTGFRTGKRYILIAIATYVESSGAAEWRLGLSGACSDTLVTYAPGTLVGAFWFTYFVATSNSLAVNVIYRGPSGLGRIGDRRIIAFEI